MRKKFRKGAVLLPPQRSISLFVSAINGLDFKIKNSSREEFWKSLLKSEPYKIILDGEIESGWGNGGTE